MKNAPITKEGCAFAVAWSVACRSKCGAHCGDGYTLMQHGRQVYAWVIDGLGSGLLAQKDADTGLQAVQSEMEAGLARTFDFAHSALKQGRGAAMAGVTIDLARGVLTWAAVGDVDGVVLHRGEVAASLIQKSGTLGLNYPGPSLTQVQLEAGDVILLSTDGISRRYRTDLPSQQPIEGYSQKILHQYGKVNDDCLVLGLEVLAAS